MTDEDARARAKAFVREVEAAMADLPRGQRVELTGGLVDHLLEPGDDGRRPIDDELDPRSYADDLRAASPPTPVARRGKRVRYIAGAALVGLLLSVGAWLGFAHLSSRESAEPEPTPTPAGSSGAAQVQVPDVRGQIQADALTVLESANLSAEFSVLPEDYRPPMTAYLESGDVADTDPFAGTLVDEGSVVVLMLIP